jgi:hypothetical protein
VLVERFADDYGYDDYDDDDYDVVEGVRRQHPMNLRHLRQQGQQLSGAAPALKNIQLY